MSSGGGFPPQAPPPGFPPGYPPAGGYGGPPPPRKGKGPLIAVLAVLAVLVVAIAIVVVVLLTGDDGDEADRDADDRDDRSTSAATEASSVTVPPTDAGSSGSTESTDSSDDAAALVGRWEGNYTCTQGLTALTLTIEDDLTAVFEFGPTTSNPTVQEGSYRMSGAVVGGYVYFAAADWISQPDGYFTVDLQARLDPSTPDQLTGEVVAEGCTSFVVNR